MDFIRNNPGKVKTLCESTKWATNSYTIAIKVPFNLNSNLDGNSSFSSSFSDDFMNSVVIEFLHKQCSFIKDMNNDDKFCLVEQNDFVCRLLNVQLY